MKLNSKSFQIFFILAFYLLIVFAKSEELHTKVKVKAESNTNILSSNNAETKNRKFSAEQQKQFDKIPKPTLSIEMSDNIKFMQKEISKAYSLAMSENNVRFMEAAAANEKFMSLFPEDKSEEGIPVNREVYIDIFIYKELHRKVLFPFIQHGVTPYIL